MVRCKDGAYVCFEQHEEIIDNLRSVAEDNKKECEATRSENARLKAEVERLTKTGDAMLYEWGSGDEKDAKNFLKALAIWNAAKEGKDQP